MLKTKCFTFFAVMLVLLSPLSVSAQDMGSLINEWEKSCNNFIEKYKNLPQNEIEKILLDERTLESFQSLPEVERLNSAMQDVFNELLQNQGDRTKLPGSRQALLNKLEASGLRLAMGEGQYWLQPDNKIVYKAFLPHVSAAMQDYLTCLSNQPDSFFSDGGLKFPVRNYIQWAQQWDDFLVKHPSLNVSEQAQKAYRFLMMTALFCDLPNTPAFPRYNKGKMQDEWLLELHTAVQAHPDGRTTAIVNDFLKAVKRNGNKISKSNRSRIEKQIFAVK